MPWESGLEDQPFWALLHSVFHLGLVKSRRGWGISSLLSPCFGEVSRTYYFLLEVVSTRQLLLNGSSLKCAQVSRLCLHVPSATGVVTVTAVAGPKIPLHPCEFSVWPHLPRRPLHRASPFAPPTVVDVYLLAGC